MSEKDAYYQKRLEELNDPQRLFSRPGLPESPRKFHIIGICGTAMGALAGLLREKGYIVSGSDQACHDPIKSMLDGLDVSVYAGNYEAKNIAEDVDVVVIGNVSTPKNPEAAYARENNLVQAVLPEVFTKYIFGDAKRIVVSGTHGKTTTTGLVAAIFDAAGKEPGFMIGGVPQGKEKGFALGKGEVAILEGDEYDTSYFNKMPKFLQYNAHTGIVTSVELDHLDIYNDFDDYKKAFEFYVEDFPTDGFLFVNGDDVVTRSLKDKTNARVRTYGLKNNNDVYAKNVKSSDQGSGVRGQKFDLVFDGEVMGKIETSLSGDYNISNIAVACGVGLAHGLSFEDIKKGVRNFTGMKRRQEITTEVNNITVMDDFAHHPTAVKKTIAGLKDKYPDRRLIVLFEPRSNSSRKKVFEAQYIESFDDADMVAIKMPPFRHNDEKIDFIDVEKVIQGIKDRGTESYFYENTDTMLEEVIPKLKEGDLVITMSNGSFDSVQEKIKSLLSTSPYS